jgi:hypothetical protein
MSARTGTELKTQKMAAQKKQTGKTGRRLRLRFIIG